MSANKSYTYNSQEPIAQINTDGVHLQFENSINQNGNNHIIVKEVGTINSYTLDSPIFEAIQSTTDAAVSKSMGRIVEEIMPAEPLNTVGQFMELERLLQKDEEYAKFKSELMQNIKYTGAKFVRTAWRSLLSDECAQHLAWSGKSDKKSVRVLKVSMAIRGVFLHEVKGNETEYIRGTKTIFQFAKNRQNRSNK